MVCHAHGQWRLAPGPAARARPMPKGEKMATVAAEGQKPAATTWWREISRYQWLILIGTLLGWGLDGFDGNLYALVVGPAVTELLRNGGIATPTPAQIGFYGGVEVTLSPLGGGL